MPEFCGVSSKSPTVKAVQSTLDAEEASFDFAMRERVVAAAQNMDIREIAEQTSEQDIEVETVDAVSGDEVVLDIRSYDEQEDKPLKSEGLEGKSLPFYTLATQFGDLEQNRNSVLYCDRGVMSRVQALYLKEQGYNNVKVYRP